MAQNQETLKQLLQRVKSQNPDMTKRDAVEALEQYRGLQPKVDTFVFNDGSLRELACLEGTIPVHYKGTTYNIPVCIWLLDTHPFNAPMCYVVPTQDMEIQVSRHVDHNGKVYLPYLHDWNHSSSDLLGLIQVLIITFSEQPPVYSRPRAEASGQSPYPKPTYMANQGTSTGSSYPGYPPQYPPSSANQMPYPPYPPTGGSTRYPVPYPPQYPSSFSSTTSYPPYPPQPGNATTHTTNSTSTITEEHIRASVLSAVEDKVRRRQQEIFGQAQAELETLQRTQTELNTGKAKLENFLQRLENEQVELEKNVAVLQEKLGELEDATKRLENQEPVDVDEAVTTTAPLYKQLLTAFAEEAATEDAIYYLAEALRKGVLELDVFLKHVRSLSRRQFMLRALMMKCRLTGGLAG